MQWLSGELPVSQPYRGYILYRKSNQSKTRLNQKAMQGWDPSTGQPIERDDLSDLIKAAGGTPSLPVANDTSNTLCIKLNEGPPIGGGAQTQSQFHTLDVYEAQSRICSFFNAIQNPNMHVKIEFGSLSAIAFLDPQNRVQTLWMDKSFMKYDPTNPPMVYYTANEFPSWAYNISNCFLNVLKLRNEINRIKDIASRRTTGSSEVVNTTPPTAWLNTQAPSMVQQGVVHSTHSIHPTDYMNFNMQGVLYA